MGGGMQWACCASFGRFGRRVEQRGEEILIEAGVDFQLRRMSIRRIWRVSPVEAYPQNQLKRSTRLIKYLR
jgi:hypothetical protein